MFGLFKKKQREYFTPAEKDIIVKAIQEAERRTSGEIRIYVESKCEMVNPVLRAREIFYQLKMDQTASRNGVLLYLAMDDHQLAVFGDEGIHQKVGHEFWEKEVAIMLKEFKQKHFIEGIAHIVEDIGEALVTHFPYDGTTDKNELPDDIVFG
ncbi:MAG: TPM domain-containing protein [Sediminibacterium sp.]